MKKIALLTLIGAVMSGPSIAQTTTVIPREECHGNVELCLVIMDTRPNSVIVNANAGVTVTAHTLECDAGYTMVTLNHRPMCAKDLKEPK